MPKVVVEGLEKAMKKLGPELYSDALREFWKDAATAVMSAAQNAAPNDTGQLRGSLDIGGPGNVFEVARMNPPEWAKVGTDVNNKGFRYPWALQAGARYHFRADGADNSSPGARKPTKGWFSEAFERAMGDIQSKLGEMIKAIAKRWEE